MMLDRFIGRAKGRETTSKYLERDLRSMVRDSSKYRNLDSKNQEVLFDLVKKYREKLRKYHRIDSYTIKKEMNRIFRKRIKLNLTEEDIKDIREILEEFKTE